VEVEYPIADAFRRFSGPIDHDETLTPIDIDNDQGCFVKRVEVVAVISKGEETFNPSEVCSLGEKCVVDLQFE
ncbi:hypothetical protein PENTCL1PPCAC_22225, partial [Pristionchus entomophagus]